LFWAGSFAANYVIALSKSSTRRGLLATYPFVHFPPRHFQDLDEIIRTAFGWQQDPWVLALVGITFFAFVLGAWALLRRRPIAFWLLTAPLFIALILSALHRYPILGRFMLFTAPAALVLVADGVEEVRRATRGYPIPIGGILLCLIVAQPLFVSAEYVLQPVQAEEFKSALKYAVARQQPGDVFYIYCYAQHSFEYYAELYGLSHLSVVKGSCFRAGMKNHVFTYNWNFLRDDFARLQGQKRVWLLFTHDGPVDGLDEKMYALRFLNQDGKLLDVHYERGATVYLYDLSQPPAPSAAP
jgi:hypothetical protein